MLGFRKILENINYYDDVLFKFLQLLKHILRIFQLAADFCQPFNQRNNQMTSNSHWVAIEKPNERCKIRFEKEINCFWKEANYGDDSHFQYGI